MMDNKDLAKDIDLENLLFHSNRNLGSVLLEFLKMLLKRKWIIFICLITIILPVTIWTFTQSPIYYAEATIIYEEPQDTMFALDVGQPFYNKSATLNMIEQIRSRKLADEVVEILPDAVKNTFKLPESLAKGFTREKFIGRLIQKKLRIEAVRGSDIIKISIEAMGSAAAKIIIDAYVNKIIEWNLQKKKEEISNIRSFVEGQVSVFQDKLNTSEEEVLEFKEKNNMVSISDASKEMLKSLTGAEVAYNEAKTEREALEQRWHYIEQKKRELIPSLIVTNSKTTEQLKQELLNLETQYSSFQFQANSEDQVKILSFKEKINQTKRDLINELMRNAIRENLIDPLSQVRSLLQESITIEVDIETFKAKELGLKQIMDNYSRQLQTLPKQELDLARYIRTKDVNDKIYALLLEKREEARITEAGKVGDVRIIDPAEESLLPLRPKKKKNLAFGFVLGLAFGIGLALFLESADNSVKTEDDVEQQIKLPLLASIPTLNSNELLNIHRKNRHAKENYSKNILNQFADIPHFFEAYRAFQLNFTFVNAEKQIKSVLITSARAGEGKTLTTINIAQIFARTGTKTLLVDCDLRRPMVHKILNLSQEPGLTNLLINESNVSQALQQSGDSNLAIITCGKLPPNPSEILNSNRMTELLESFKRDFDLVILDTPPVIAVTDSIILGSKIDGVCLVIESGKTTPDIVTHAKKILEKSGIRIIGVILNNVNLKNNYGYYKDYYYYSSEKKRKKYFFSKN